jgi:hypothetical protein
MFHLPLRRVNGPHAHSTEGGCSWTIDLALVLPNWRLLAQELRVTDHLFSLCVPQLQLETARNVLGRK